MACGARGVPGQPGARGGCKLPPARSHPSACCRALQGLYSAPAELTQPGWASCTNFCARAISSLEHTSQVPLMQPFDCFQNQSNLAWLSMPAGESTFACRVISPSPFNASLLCTPWPAMKFLFYHVGVKV